MTERIEPALSAEEWAAAYAPEGNASLGFEAVHSELVQAADNGRWHKAMALANAALPNADPRKLTARDVQLLEVAGEILGERERQVTPTADDLDELRSTIHDLAVLSTKLAALLGPEGA